jgi:hypothetical protein
MRYTTRQDIVEANAVGLRHKDTDTYWSYYTPTLQVAYNLGLAGVDLSDAPDVAGYRYGSAPDSCVSYNHAEARSERGLSLACLDGEQEIGSSVWFADREVIRYTGLLAGRGSDGEPIILCYQAPYLD